MQRISQADLNAAVPDLVTPQHFATLRVSAVIRRDRWGIPHIKADDEYDLFFAQGFSTAQDRLFQMDLDRMRSLGRASEYLGRHAVKQDQYVRRMRLERVAKRDYALASPAARNALDAYADGVNAFLESARSLPVEYKLLGTKAERWAPWHCIAVFKVRNTAEGTFQGKLWLARLAAELGAEQAARVSPGCQPESLLTIPPGERYRGPVLRAIEELRAVIAASSILSEVDGGSNGWVISGERTASGLPLLAGDSHRALEAPNVYSQVHLIGRDFAVLGYALPGFPMALHFCHNEHVAWGMTAGGVDTQDLFVERFREKEDRLEYLHEDGWRLASVEFETIRVSGRADEQLELVETHHGPVIAGDPRAGAAITLCDPGSRDATPWIDAAYKAMRARSGRALVETLSGWTDRVNNYLYADVEGHFGYALRGRVPIRGSVNGWGPVSGWTSDHDWLGYVPAEMLPQAHDPERGWVVSCNQRVVDQGYPYYLTNFCSTAYRAERIASRIAILKKRQEQSGLKATVDDMSALHADTVSIPAQSLQKALTRVNARSDQASRAAKTLIAWDGSVTLASAAAALYEVTAAKLAARLAVANYGSAAADLLEAREAGAEEHWRRHLKAALYVALEEGDESWVPAGERWASLLSRVLEESAAYLEERLGTDWAMWSWGQLHHTAQQHPLAPVFPEAAALLNPPVIETPGDGDTPFVACSRSGVSFRTEIGSVNRYIHDPSDWSNGCWIVPLGASGHPGSVHYADQQTLWAEARTIPQLWDWEEIGRQAETEQRLISTGAKMELATGFQFRRRE